MNPIEIALPLGEVAKIATICRREGVNPAMIAYLQFLPALDYDFPCWDGLREEAEAQRTEPSAYHMDLDSQLLI